MGLNIKKAIKERGLEVREVAQRMGITPTGLSQHINGNPTIDVLNRIADAIGCEVVELFDCPTDPDELTAFVEFRGQIYVAHNYPQFEAIAEDLRAFKERNGK